MKFLFTLLVGSFILASTPALAQEEGGQRIKERMLEYLQKRLNLNQSESAQFAPVFDQYFNEIRKANQENRNDRLLLQQKVIEIRLQYRNQFTTIMGERRANDVFVYEREFIEEVKNLRNERRRPPPKGGRNQ